MPGDPGATVVTTLVCYQHTAHEAAGATGTRHSPRPLLGDDFMHSSGESCRGNADVYLKIAPTPLSLRTQGPITTNVSIARSWGRSSVYNRQRWLWVPAFAGTTSRNHPAAYREITLRPPAPYARHRRGIWIGPRQCVRLSSNRLKKPEFREADFGKRQRQGEITWD